MVFLKPTILIDSDVANEIFVGLTELVDQMVANGQQPVVLAAPHTRLAFRKLPAATTAMPEHAQGLRRDLGLHA